LADGAGAGRRRSAGLLVALRSLPHVAFVANDFSVVRRHALHTALPLHYASPAYGWHEGSLLLWALDAWVG